MISVSRQNGQPLEIQSPQPQSSEISMRIRIFGHKGKYLSISHSARLRSTDRSELSVRDANLETDPSLPLFDAVGTFLWLRILDNRFITQTTDKLKGQWALDAMMG